MPYDVSEHLDIGLASSALFDLAESGRVFREQGEAAYRRSATSCRRCMCRSGSSTRVSGNGRRGEE
ncbi:MAG: 5'-nucleotidase [Pseudomonadota bacterium]